MAEETYFGKGISVASNFDIAAAKPADNKFIVKTIEERDAHVAGNRAYEGMLVYVEADGITYQYAKTDDGLGLDWKIFGAVIDNLTSTETQKALSANQGRILNNKIESVAGGDLTVPTATTTKIGGIKSTSGIGNVSVASDGTATVASAPKLGTARTITVEADTKEGGVSGTFSFDGSQNVSFTTSLNKVPASKVEGVLALENIPRGAQERLIVVANTTAMLALTTDDVQQGDTVKVTSPAGEMYYVKDETKLGTMDAFEVYTAGAASSAPWSGITDKPDFKAVATSGSYTDLINKPTSLKNPNAISVTIGGASAVLYDGSEAKALTITPETVGADTVGSAAAVQANLDTHTGNTTIHITSSERATWNAKSNLALTSAAPEDLAETAQVGTATTAARADHVHKFPTAAQVGAPTTTAFNTLNGTVSTHTADTTIHITSSERTLWNGKAAVTSTVAPLTSVQASASIGTSSESARADHVHKTPAVSQLQDGAYVLMETDTFVIDGGNASIT